jgi:ankyrin repeat protein
MMEAAKLGHVNMLEYLLQCGADVRYFNSCLNHSPFQINTVSPNNDATALSLACLYGHADATQFLLENGANPEVALKDGVSCIIEASRNGNTDCARIVLDSILAKEGKIDPSMAIPQHPPTSTAAEISQRPKIKPVSKLQQQANREAGLIIPNQLLQQHDTDTANAIAQEFALLGQKISPEWAAAAASLKVSVGSFWVKIYID